MILERIFTMLKEYPVWVLFFWFGGFSGLVA